MKRREFLATMPLGLASEVLLGRDRRNLLLRVGKYESATTEMAQSSSPPYKLDFASALEAAEAIRRKTISSKELVLRTFQRIDRYNPQINAFSYQLREEALAQAKKADDALSQGRSLGIFHGVPIHVKECFGVAGHPCTWGIVPFRNSKTPRNAVVVDRLLRAGAVLIGATNVPVGLTDWQSYNPIYGTTNNPWDLKRTSGALPEAPPQPSPQGWVI